MNARKIIERLRAIQIECETEAMRLEPGNGRRERFLVTAAKCLEICAGLERLDVIDQRGRPLELAH